MVNIEVEPFLTLPFEKKNYQITEGWNYSEKEKEITGFTGHGGIDFELAFGSTILAAADGWAISSYMNFPIKDEKGQVKLYQGKPLGFGYGYFVQIFHPKEVTGTEIPLYTTYGHLLTITGVPFHKPRKTGDSWWPVGNKVSPDLYPLYHHARYIKSGQVIGYSGFSGLTWGYDDYPNIPDPKFYPSWDKPHLHFEVATRVGYKKKKRFFDPYGIKSQAQDYPDSSKKGQEIGSKSPNLWILDDELMPKHANALEVAQRIF